MESQRSYNTRKSAYDLLLKLIGDAVSSDSPTTAIVDSSCEVESNGRLAIMMEIDSHEVWIELTSTPFGEAIAHESLTKYVETGYHEGYTIADMSKEDYLIFIDGYDDEYRTAYDEVNGWSSELFDKVLARFVAVEVAKTVN
jgi:hypothetical protein